MTQKSCKNLEIKFPLDTDDCVVCLDNKSNCLMECGHVFTCEKCSKRLWSEENNDIQCPQCRRYSKNIVIFEPEKAAKYLSRWINNILCEYDENFTNFWEDVVYLINSYSDFANCILRTLTLYFVYEYNSNFVASDIVEEVCEKLENFSSFSLSDEKLVPILIKNIQEVDFPSQSYIEKLTNYIIENSGNFFVSGLISLAVIKDKDIYQYVIFGLTWLVYVTNNKPPRLLDMKTLYSPKSKTCNE